MININKELTARDLMEKLFEIRGVEVINFAPIPFEFEVNDNDRIAAYMLKWLFDHYDSMTVEDYRNILEAARFWFAIFASMPILRINK